jgi:hypothetical protein
MANFDERLIDPDETQLARVLGRAMKAANRENKHQPNRMERDAAFWGRFARDVLKSGGAEGRRRSCKGGRAVPEVVAGWWTDPANRKHVRVVGRTRRQWTRLRGEVEMRSLPPWWHVYPEAVLGVRQKKGGEQFLAVCRCGACGSPTALGWMGDTCGPCFDRRAEGGTSSGGFGQFAGWLSNLGRFAFTPDGRHLVGQKADGTFWKVSRDDGSAVASKRKSVQQMAAVVADADKLLLVTGCGSIYRWKHDADDVSVLSNRGMWGRVAVSPDGTRAVLLSYRESHTCDLTAARPKWVRGPAPEGIHAIQFHPDGRLLATTGTHDLRVLDPDTMESQVLRDDIYSGMAPWSGSLADLVVSPDGSAALLRRDSYTRRGTMVHHVPLSGGKPVALRIPEWHRATSIAYSPDGKHAVTAEAEGGWVGFFDTASGKSVGFVRAVLEDTAWRSGHLEFSPDGTALGVSYNGTHSEAGSTVAVWPWPDVLLSAEC